MTDSEILNKVFEDCKHRCKTLSKYTGNKIADDTNAILYAAYKTILDEIKTLKKD